MTVIVRIWLPITAGGRSVGHASIETDERYASIGPSGDCKKQLSGVPAKFRTYADDIDPKKEKRPEDYAIQLYFLDESKINEEFAKFRNFGQDGPNWHLLGSVLHGSKNCAGLSYHLLKAGGLVNIIGSQQNVFTILEWAFPFIVTKDLLFARSFEAVLFSASLTLSSLILKPFDIYKLAACARLVENGNDMNELLNHRGRLLYEMRARSQTSSLTLFKPPKLIELLHAPSDEALLFLAQGYSEKSQYGLAWYTLHRIGFDTLDQNLKTQFFTIRADIYLWCRSKSPAGDKFLEAAEADLNEALEIDSSHTHALRGRAFVYYKKRQYDIAKQDIEFSRRPEKKGGEPYEPFAFYLLAKINYELGFSLDNVLSHLDSALDENRTSIPVKLKRSIENFKDTVLKKREETNSSTRAYRQ